MKRIPTYKLKNGVGVQDGGMNIQPKQIPMFKDGSATNPFVTNDMRQVKQTLANEGKPKLGQVPNPETLFEFKINDRVIQYPDPKQPPTDPFKGMINQGIYPSPYVPVPNPFFPNIQNPAYPWSYAANNNIPLIKKYNISISNANGDLTKLHDLYEDVLPSVNGIVQKSLTTIAERTIIYQYLRSIFIKHNDGEDISIGNRYPTDGQRKELTNLLSHIKLMEINPYHFSKLTNNPYKTLPDNFLMFRSCYPVRLNRNNNVVTCAQDNLGVNIRIYQMKVLDILAGKMGPELTKKDCDLWREISYYEYIREHIVKQKRCPNFIVMYAWYETVKSGVDFIKLQQLRINNLKNVTKMEQNIEVLNLKIREDITRIMMEIGDGIEQINKLGRKSLDGFKVFKKEKSKIALDNDEVTFDIITRNDELAKFNIQYPTNKCIVAITEAPNHNLFDWGTKAYELDMGPIKKMVQTGYHDLKVWQSIMFQLLAALHIMNIEDILINEMSIENNVYVKDLNKDETNIGYWKYKVNGIDYYIPNYGYLVLIDSKFNDLEGGQENVVLGEGKKIEYNYKIYGSMFEDEELEVYEKKKKNMKTIFDTNNFLAGFTQHGGIKPPKEILTMINEINKMVDSVGSPADLRRVSSELFLKTQSHFLNNRIGEFVKEIEKDQLIKDGFKFKPGDIIAELTTGQMAGNNSTEAYKWGLYIEPNIDPNTNTIIEHKIYTTDSKYYGDNKPLTIKNVSDGSIFRSYTPVEQNYKPNQKLSEDDILETYIVSNDI